MTNGRLYKVANGLATLGPELVRLRDLLDARFVAWATDCDAERMVFPPLMSIKELDALDYFRNFPHLAVATSRIRAENLSEDYASSNSIAVIPSTHLMAADYVLPSAACYSIYLYLGGKMLQEPVYVTTSASCFRNESEYIGLQRLWGFTMREIVCVGPAAAVQSHLGSFKARIKGFTDRIGLQLETQAATDPFYEPQGSRAVMQKLFPVKEEFVWDSTVAIASVNFHRNFFGERCGIRTPDGEASFSGCVAFGIERWIHALLGQFKGDVHAALEAIAI